MNFQSVRANCSHGLAYGLDTVANTMNGPDVASDSLKWLLDALNFTNVVAPGFHGESGAEFSRSLNSIRRVTTLFDIAEQCRWTAEWLRSDGGYFPREYPGIRRINEFALNCLKSALNILAVWGHFGQAKLASTVGETRAFALLTSYGDLGVSVCTLIEDMNKWRYDSMDGKADERNHHTYLLRDMSNIVSELFNMRAFGLDVLERANPRAFAVVNAGLSLAASTLHFHVEHRANVLPPCAPDGDDATLGSVAV